MEKNKLIESITGLINGLSQFAYYGKISAKDIENQFIHSVLLNAKENNPKLKISELNQMTGVSRAKIKKVLENKKPVFKQDKLATLLTELWKLKDNNGMVSLKGETSFYSSAQVIINSSYSLLGLIVI